MRRDRAHVVRWTIAAVGIMAAAAGCQPAMYDPDRATRAYPSHLHTDRSVDIQVFRDGESIEMRNATATTYADFDLWVNQRFVSRVDSLPAGGRVKLSLWNFWDERGEAINAGGVFRVDAPTPVRLVQIQTAPDAPLISCISIRAEPIVTQN